MNVGKLRPKMILDLEQNTSVNLRLFKAYNFDFEILDLYPAETLPLTSSQNVENSRSFRVCNN